MTDKACKQRFQVPYVVRRRRRQRKGAEKSPARQVATSCQACDSSLPRASSRGCSVTPAGRRSRSRGRSCSRGHFHSRVRIQETAWADRVKQKPPKVTKGSPPEQSNLRVAHLEQKNAQLRAALQQLRAEFESFRKSGSSVPPAQAPMELPAETQEPARSAKKRALAEAVNGEGDLEEFKSEIRNSMKEV